MLFQYLTGFAIGALAFVVAITLPQAAILKHQANKQASWPISFWRAYGLSFRAALGAQVAAIIVAVLLGLAGAKEHALHVPYLLASVVSWYFLHSLLIRRASNGGATLIGDTSANALTTRVLGYTAALWGAVWLIVFVALRQ